MIEKSRHVIRYQQLSRISKKEFDIINIYCDKYAKTEGLDEKVIASLRVLAVNSYYSNDSSEGWPIVRPSDIKDYSTIYKPLEEQASKRQEEQASKKREEQIGNEAEIEAITLYEIREAQKKYGKDIDQRVKLKLNNIKKMMYKDNKKGLIEAWRDLEGEADEKTREMMKEIIKSVREFI
jgi:hypothetical protein